MADGDDHFRLGVQHGFANDPLYRWQDPFHQERYETGYVLGRWQRVTQVLRPGEDGESWDVFAARLQRQGLVRGRS